MKKRIALVLFLLSMTTLLSCASKQNIVMKLDDSKTPSRLIWGDRIYDDCGVVDGDRSIGEQIGTVKGISDSRVFRVTNKSEQDSLIVTRTDEMTIYELYKRETSSGASSGKQGKS